MRRIPPALAFVCVAGAALRFATLDVQSLWFDEAVTAQLLRMDLWDMLRAIPDSESTPPLFYLLAWPWTHVFGSGEVGLRSLPALLGTATIPVAWALGRRLGGDRVAIVAALLVAVNPLLVWFSQEARAYALLALLAAIAALLWLRALERPSAGRAAAWSLVAALACATHYYAIFLIAPMGLWLVVEATDARVRAAAVAPLAIALAALAPLALDQRANDSAAFIGDSALGTRIVQVPKQLLVGYDAPAETALAIVSCLLLALALAGLWRLLAGRQATDALRLTVVASVALLGPAVAALVGEDHLITRNLLAVSPLGAALAAAGLMKLERARPGLGRSAVVAACVLGIVTVAGVAADRELQRDDWRGAVRALGHAPGERLVVATPASALAPLRYYLPSVRKLATPATLTAEIDYVALPRRDPGERPKPPRPRRVPTPVQEFTLAGRSDGETFTVLRLRAHAPVAVAGATVATGLDGRTAAVLVASR
jgi:mannosyltransferase